MATAQQVAIAHKLYEARRTLRLIMGDEYASQVRDFMAVLSQVAEARGEAVLKAGIHAADVAISEGSEIAAWWFLAATVELIEPDELTPVKARTV